MMSVCSSLLAGPVESWSEKETQSTVTWLTDWLTRWLSTIFRKRFISFDYAFLACNPSKPFYSYCPPSMAHYTLYTNVPGKIGISLCPSLLSSANGQARVLVVPDWVTWGGQGGGVRFKFLPRKGRVNEALNVFVCCPVAKICTTITITKTRVKQMCGRMCGE